MDTLVSTQQVISAQQLPKLNKDKDKSIVDPLVRVELYGVPADNASKETHYISNNGDRTRKPSLSSDMLASRLASTTVRLRRIQPHVEPQIPV